MAVTSPSAAVAGSIPDFAEARALLPTAEALASECFREIRARAASLETDPETGERWIALQVIVDGDVKEIADAYDCFVARWVSAIPFPQHNWVRLAYRIV